MRPQPPRTPRLVIAVILLLLLATACTTPLYHDLDEGSANAIIVTLSEHGLSAEKLPDPAVEGRWIIEVPTAERHDAWKTLQAQGLPRPPVKGFDAHYPSAGLIPSASEERIVLQYATSQELRRTLLAIERVTDAQVNLVLPERARIPLPSQTPEPPRASVLITYRPTEKAPAPPLTDERIATLVAGGVEGLDPAHVRVVQLPQAAIAPSTAPQLAHVGPIAVAPQSKRWMQLILGAMSLVILVMSALIAVLLLRSRSAAAASST